MWDGLLTVRIQHCNPTRFEVVYPHILPNGNETWAAKAHNCSYDWEQRAWKTSMIKPGDWVRVSPEDGNCLSRGKGCRPQGMVIACVGSDFLILWSGDAKVERQFV